MFMTDEIAEIESVVSPQSGVQALEELRSSGALDALFAKIDAGGLRLTGEGGFVPGLIKAALERGLRADRAFGLRARRSGGEVL